MRRTRMLVWLFALWAVTSPGQTSTPPSGGFIVRAWGTGDGLPQNTVTSIIRTRDGYLWLGTFGGLVRFDGHAFTVFNPDNGPGLASGRIVSLYEDSQRVLWIGTEAGLTRFEQGRFTSYGVKDGILAGTVWVTLRDSHGRLWVGSDGGLMRFDGRRFSPVLTAGIRSSVQSLAEGPDGTIWAATYAGIARVRDGETATTMPPTPGRHPIVRSVLFDREGRLWAGGDELSRWDGTRFVDVPLPAPIEVRGNVTSLSQDADGNLWIGTTLGGAFQWQDGVIRAHDTAAGLSDVSVRSVLGDPEGNVWIGTEVGGLNRLKRRHVFSYQRPGTSEQSLGPMIGDGDGGLWIGATCGGLLHFVDGVFRTYHNGDAMNCIWALHRDPDGTVWIGSTASGLTRFAGGRFTSYGTAEGLPSATVMGVARDRQGVLWVGTPQGLSRWDGVRFKNYGAAEGLMHDVKCILQDRRGALWLGGLAGLSRFENGRFTRYTTAQGLSHEHVRAIHEDADGVLWIGTYGGGLNRLKDGRFTTYGIKEGLPDTAVSRILEDARGNLWMSGNNGVYRVARSQLNDFADGRISYITAVSYGTADGMVIDETNGGQPAGWQTPDGRLWFPTIKGLVAIDPLGEAAKPPRVLVERAVVDGRSIDAGALPPLGPGGSDAEFHYTAIDLGAAEKTRFRYRLAGHDPQWIDVGTRRVAYYTNIPPGHYDFEVAATDSDGNWSATSTRVAVVVIPFWWQRREVIAAGLIILLAGTGFGARQTTLRRTRARMAELEREQTLERERTRIARDLHDDLGSRLSHIAIMAGGSADGDRDRIAREAREAVQTMDELVWAVNARNDTVENFAYYVAQFAEEHVIAAGLRCRLLLPPDLPPRPLAADVRRHLYLAVKEAINNGLKHARASEIRLGLRLDADALVVEVADDGRGLPAELDPTGNGLKNFHERMAAAGGTVEVTSAPGQGTRLVFRTPL